jgi:effector-binding domain-containing protein
MNDLVPIGRFSRMTRLSVKALRHYAELGILEPSWVDPSSGYRYYRPAQANLAEAIRVLRSVDMPLDEIGEILAQHDPELVAKRLHMHRERLQERLADQERMLRYLEHLIEREEGLMPYEVSIKQVEPRRVAGHRLHTKLETIGVDIGTGFGVLMQALGMAQAAPAGAPFIIYHDVIDEQTHGDIELCVPVPAGMSGPDGPVEWKDLDGGTVASTIHRGPYDQIGPAYHTVSGWIQDHGHQTIGAPREIYLNDPQQVAEEDILTEVQWPIADEES